MDQRNKWLAFVRSLMASKEVHEYMTDVLDHPAYQPYPGWSWVEVGHNASHWFCVGRNADYTQFAVSSNQYDPETGIDECKVYRVSSDLDTTLSGVYLGNKE